jgi:hypothetical protein
MKNLLALVLVLLGTLFFHHPAPADLIFFDDFSADKGWGNQRGDWSIGGGVYRALSPNNLPPTYSSAPTPVLTNFIVEMEVNNLSDGGIWLRSSYINGKASGLLLVTGGQGGAYNGLYWHIFHDDLFSDAFGHVSIPGLQGTNRHLKIEAQGSTYKVYLDGGANPLTTLVDSNFYSGLVAVYGYSPTLIQTLDNVQIFKLYNLHLPLILKS